MTKVQAQRARRVLTILCACGLLPLAGCGGLKLVPVSGKMTMNGKPLTGGGVSFVPDASKGNEARVACLGRIGPQGQYEAKTAGVQGSQQGKGVPLGWYKVIIVTSVMGSPPIKVDPIYTDPEKTPFSIEVIANPAPDRYHFDLKE